MSYEYILGILDLIPPIKSWKVAITPLLCWCDVKPNQKMNTLFMAKYMEI